MQKNQQHEINSEKTTKCNHPEMTKMLERVKQVKVEAAVVFKNIKESKFKINKKTGNLARWTATTERNQSARTKNYNGRNSLSGLKKILDVTEPASLKSHRHYPTRGQERKKNTKNAHSLNYADDKVKVRHVCTWTSRRERGPKQTNKHTHKQTSIMAKNFPV